MVIFGKKERALFEEGRDSFPETIRHAYDAATLYHDGKWIMIDVCDSTQMQGIKAMLGIKKKPKKQAKS